MTDHDLKIGANIAHWRGEESQQSIADAMREKGWKWSQATMWALEKGERSLKLAEASDLAEILHIQVEQLLSPQGATALWILLEQAAGAVEAAAIGLSLEVSDLLIYQDQLRKMLPDYLDGKFREQIRVIDPRAMPTLDDLIDRARAALQLSPEDEVIRVRELREQGIRQRKEVNGVNQETS